MPVLGLLCPRSCKQAVIAEQWYFPQTPQMLLICMQLRKEYLLAHQKSLTNASLSIPIKPPLTLRYRRNSDIYQQTNDEKFTFQYFSIKTGLFNVLQDFYMGGSADIHISKALFVSVKEKINMSNKSSFFFYLSLCLGMLICPCCMSHAVFGQSICFLHCKCKHIVQLKIVHLSQFSPNRYQHSILVSYFVVEKSLWLTA